MQCELFWGFEVGFTLVGISYIQNSRQGLKINLLGKRRVVIFGDRKDRNLIFEKVSAGVFTCQAMCFNHYCHPFPPICSGRTHSFTR